MLKDTAEAVRADLQTASDAATFVRSFTPERSHSDLMRPLEDDELHVDVVAVKAGPIRSVMSDRATDGEANLEYTIQVDVGIRKKFGDSETDPSTGRAATNEVDELDLLTEQIHAYFVKQRRLTDYDIAAWTETEPQIRTSGAGTTLRLFKLYLGIVRLEFSVIKAV